MIASILIILVTLYLIKNIFSDIKISNPLGTEEVEETIVSGKFIPKTLAKYNGLDDPKIFIAVRGRVFDVTNGATFYGPGGPYENFAGRDASRGLALNSFDPAVLTPLEESIDSLDGLDAAELESLDGWEEHFENKYRIVGTLHNVLDEDASIVGKKSS